MFSHSVVSDSLDPMDCSPLGSSVPGILQARILMSVTVSFSSGSSSSRDKLESPALLAVSVSLSHLGRPVGVLKVVTQLPQY